MLDYYFTLNKIRIIIKKNKFKNLEMYNNF